MSDRKAVLDSICKVLGFNAPVKNEHEVGASFLDFLKQTSQINYTCTYLADHLESLNHDNMSYFLAHNSIRPRSV